MEAIRTIQVKVLPDHTPVLLHDVAEVRLGTATALRCHDLQR
jgi:hypothetical protein